MILRGFTSRLRQLDWVLLALSLILVCFGLATLYSVGIAANDGDASRVLKQAGFAGVGVIVLFALSSVDHRLLRSWKNALYVAGVFLLGGVLVFGTVIRETQRWYSISGITIQPAEFVKVILIVFLAGTLSRELPLRNPRTIAVTGGATLLFMVLLFRQPDAGTALLFFAIWGSMLLIARISRRLLLSLLLGLVVVGGIVWQFGLQDYQQDRIRTFLNPTNDPLGVGYNVTQSIISVGSGQLVGRGLGLGPQSQLNFLPEQETDFIFAVIAEELGFLGVLIVLGTFVMLIARMLHLARKTHDVYSLTLVLGIVVAFAIQGIVNVGMNVGLLPITGVPLPFVSAGGSSLIANLAMIGILQNVSIQQRKTIFHG